MIDEDRFLVVCKMATSCYGRISESGNRVTFVISAVRRTSAPQTLENGSTAESRRHRQTKRAETDIAQPNVTAPHGAKGFSGMGDVVAAARDVEKG